jgi:hypothetical protein
MDIFRNDLSRRMPALLTRDARVVDQDVDPAPFVHGFAHHGFDLLKVGDVRAVRDGFAAGPQNFIGDGFRVGRYAIRAGEIIDHHPCSPLRQGQGVTAA